MNRDLAVVHETPVAIAQPYAAIPQSYAHPGISLSQLLTILWAYRRQTLAIILGAVVLAAIVTKLMPKTYQATATLMVDWEVNDPLGGRDFPTGLMANYLSTQIQMIKGPAVLVPAAEKLGLDREGDYRSGFSEENGASLVDYIVARLQKKLTVEQGEWNSQLINISFASDDPKEAARVANGIADVYAQQQFRRMTGPVVERDSRYTKQLNELKQRVDRAQEALAAFRQKHGLVEGQATDSDIEMERLTDLEHRLLEAQQQRRVTELRSYGDPGVRDTTVSSASVQGLRADLARLNAQMAQLSTTLGPRHPQVVELSSQIASTQRALSAEMNLYEGHAQAQVGAARSLEGQLRSAVERERRRVMEKRELQAEGAKYVLELETAQTLYRQALDGYDQVMLATTGKYNNVQYISRATPPVKAKNPKPLLNLLAALVVGTFFGIVGPLVYEFFHRRIRCPDDLDRDFGIPVLAQFDAMPLVKAEGAL